LARFGDLFANVWRPASSGAQYFMPETCRVLEQQIYGAYKLASRRVVPREISRKMKNFSGARKEENARLRKKQELK